MEYEGKTVRLKGKLRKSSSLTATAKKLKNLNQGYERNFKTFEVGRRVIDIDYFGKKFDSGCEKCGEPIKWRNLSDESQYGLCCALHFKCNNCLFVTKIYSSTRSSLQRNRRPFSVNVKAALAIIHGGVGPTHLNSILSTIGLPVVNKKTLKKRERDIGPVIETVAKKSCLDASKNEKISMIPIINETGDNEQQMTFEEALDFLETCDEEGNPEDFGDHETDPSETLSERKQPSLVEITVSQDAAWPKRGKAMNSLSGVGHVIGSKTRKCLNFATRNKRCKKCSYYEKVGRPVKEHDCRLNWNHSAKAMEADIAVQLHIEASESEMKYTNVIGDDDSSAIKHIREKVNSDVVKFSDFTHIKRSISNKLQEMSKTHKTLTDKVRKSFIKNFTYAVYQSKNKGENDLKQAIQSIVPHMYGEHNLCGQWCSYQADGAYKHKNLPYGKDLSDMHLRDALSQILQPFMSNPTKLMTSGDSQANESLNNVIFSKAPKIRNYALSESFDFRSSAGVLQFNDGPGYVQTVLHEAMLSPRKETKDYAEKVEKKRKYEKVYKSRKASKKRRIELRHDRKQGEIRSNIKLGTGYERDCILENDDLDITEIADPPKASKIKCCPEEIKTIFVDLETTKLGYDAEILQIGAHVNDEMSFNTYIIPQGQVSVKATQVTGLYVKVQNGTKSLYKNDQKVDALCPEEGISLFIDWINSVQGKVKILCAHNGNRFDFPILYKLIEKYQLTDSLEAAVTGVVDSLLVLKSLPCKRPSYSLENIYTDIFHHGYEMHDASSDARALAEIFQNINLDNETILKFAQDTCSSIKSTRQMINQRANVNILQTKLKDGPEKVISDRIAGKMCKVGVNFETLMLAHSRDKENGIKTLLSEKIDNKVRVTNRHSIIESLTVACDKKSNCSTVASEAD